jgi:hypothetical protein
MALVEPVVEAEENLAGAGGGVGLALDLHAVPARRDVDAEALLDLDQMPVVIAEQRAEQVRLLELEFEARAFRHSGEVAPRHQAAAFARTAPARLLGPASISVTSTISPGPAAVSTWTDCSHGERPTIWPGSLPLRSIRICVSQPTFDVLNASWCALIRACSR